jgi:thioredoxin reductase (NADPH)
MDEASSSSTKKPFSITVGDKTYQAKSVILATGADTKWLGVPGEAEKIGRGISSCAPCDGAFFRNKKVIVVGGGDSAMEEAQVLTKFASEVLLIHRNDKFKASEIMVNRVKENPKIKIQLNSEITQILGEQKVESVKIKNTQNGEISSMPIDGVFVAIGHNPNTKLIQGIELDNMGFIRVFDHYLTNIDGVFTAGDVHDNKYKQAITASGFGCAAALEVQKWLEDNEQ